MQPILSRCVVPAADTLLIAVTNQDFPAINERTVAPKITKSRIDQWSRSISDDASNDIALTLRAHKEVMDLLGKFSDLEKRSLGMGTWPR